jgi:hypothetical protein
MAIKKKGTGEVERERGEQHLKAKTQNLCWPECPPDQLLSTAGLLLMLVNDSSGKILRL